ncbi:MAG: serine hydrolase [Candidatus Didemnitutus sp.]|nr:serine hydrolase [Candidatus Didemnitutus sp.]
MKIGALSFALAAATTALASGRTGALQQAVDDAVAATRAEFAAPELQADQLSVTVLDLRGAEPTQADYRGASRIYPASVIKLFFLAYAHHLLAAGELADSAELQRALRDMIVESNNDATAAVVDSITRTTAGPELPLGELATWHGQRLAVTRWFESQGYRDVLAVRKTWAEGPYGREKQDAVVNLPARNYLSTNDTARLLAAIAQAHCVTPERSALMLELMARDPQAVAGDAEVEGVGFTGPALPAGAKLWSKSGWMSTVRHDAALIELPGGGRVVIVTFTQGREHANNRRIIPALARRVLAALP